MIDPYEVLGVKADSTNEEIKAAYLQLAKRLHPDAGGGADDFVRVKQAYDILIDPAARAAYDRTGYVKGDKESELNLVAFECLCKVWDEMLAQIPDERLPYSDIVAMMRDAIAANGAEFKRGLKQAKSKEKKLDKAHKIITKNMKKKAKIKGAHVFFIVIEKRLNEAKAEKVRFENQIEVADRALKLLDEYEFTPEKEDMAASLGKKSGYSEGGIIGGTGPGLSIFFR